MCQNVCILISVLASQQAVSCQLLTDTSVPRSTSGFSCGRSHYPHADHPRHIGLHVVTLYAICATLSRMKTSTSIRYNETDKLLLKALSERLGITQTAVVRQAIRLLARKEGIAVERVEKQHD